MTYFLEKYYTLDFDNTLKPALYGHCLVRPCNLDYQKVLDFFHGKMRKTAFLHLEGQIAMYNAKSAKCYYEPDNGNGFKSVEEWLIWLELNKGISPDFEEMHISTVRNILFDDYIAKTTDLHTNEVLYDSMETTLAKLKKKS